MKGEVMGPIDQNNKVISDDFHKFVLQDQPIPVTPIGTSLKKKFNIEQQKKKNKLDKKEDSPWIPKKPKKNDEDLEE